MIASAPPDFIFGPNATTDFTQEIHFIACLAALNLHRTDSQELFSPPGAKGTLEALETSDRQMLAYTKQNGNNLSG